MTHGVEVRPQLQRLQETYSKFPAIPVVHSNILLDHQVEGLPEGAERAPFIDDVARPQRVGLLLYRPSSHSAVDDHRRGGTHRVDLFRNVEAAHIRHPQVKNRNVRPFPSKHPNAFLASRPQQDRPFLARQNSVKQRQNAFLIVHDQDLHLIVRNHGIAS